MYKEPLDRDALIKAVLKFLCIDDLLASEKKKLKKGELVEFLKEEPQLRNLLNEAFEKGCKPYLKKEIIDNKELERIYGECIWRMHSYLKQLEEEKGKIKK